MDEMGGPARMPRITRQRTSGSAPGWQYGARSVVSVCLSRVPVVLRVCVPAGVESEGSGARCAHGLLAEMAQRRQCQGLLGLATLRGHLDQAHARCVVLQLGAVLRRQRGGLRDLDDAVVTALWDTDVPSGGHNPADVVELDRRRLAL